VSTIYVFSQQQQQRLPPTPHGVHGGPPGFPGGPLAAQQAVNAILTANLTDQQMRLHRSLPLRHGARAITICVDALVKNKTDAGAIAWSSDDAPRVLENLLQIADVFVLCKLDSDDSSVRAHIQRLLTEPASDEPSKKRSLEPHKILFCKTSVGKVAFVRQIEPQVHVEGMKVRLRIGCIRLMAYCCLLLFPPSGSVGGARVGKARAPHRPRCTDAGCHARAGHAPRD
jgi:hypothetical protein